MILYLIIFVLLLFIGFLLSILFDKKYRHARISYCYKEMVGINNTYFNYYFIVLYVSNGTPKSKTIQVTQEVYDTYKVDDKITI